MPNVDGGRFGSRTNRAPVAVLPDAPPDVRYPDLRVNLTGVSGNAYEVIGAVRRAMMRHRPRIDGDVIEEFTSEVTGDDYDNVLRTVLAWVDAYIELPDSDD